MSEEEIFKKKYPEYCCGKALLSPYWDLWEDGAEYGVNKANEWHDLRKDPKDVPDEGTYLVVWQNARGYRETTIMKYEEDDDEKLHWFDDEQDCWDDDVIAWREIPKFQEAAQ
jgi:hypothetical protein